MATAGAKAVMAANARLRAVRGWLAKHDQTRRRGDAAATLWYELTYWQFADKPVVAYTNSGKVELHGLKPGDRDVLIKACAALGYPYQYLAVDADGFKTRGRSFKQRCPNGGCPAGLVMPTKDGRCPDCFAYLDSPDGIKPNADVMQFCTTCDRVEDACVCEGGPKEVHPQGTASKAERCPTCDSPNPKLHPSVQHEGEAQICKDPFHDPPWIKKAREAIGRDMDRLVVDSADTITTGQAEMQTARIVVVDPYKFVHNSKEITFRKTDELIAALNQRPDALCGEAALFLSEWTTRFDRMRRKVREAIGGTVKTHE